MKLYLGQSGGASAPLQSGTPPLTPYDPGQNFSPEMDVPPQPDKWVPCPDPALLRKPSASHIEEAEKHVKSWMKYSADYVEDKIPLWKLLEDLYWNRRRLNEWNEKYVSLNCSP
jgi:hypothetical protein